MADQHPHRIELALIQASDIKADTHVRMGHMSKDIIRHRLTTQIMITSLQEGM